MTPARAQIAADDPGNWTMPGRDYASTRFSPLDQLNAGNVGKLTLAFTFSTGVLRGHEAAPIVADNTLYVITPFPNIVYALDLTQPGAPMKWKFSPYPSSSSQGEACCDVVNRGVVYANGRIYFNTLDNQTIALDARTGREAWRTQLGDIAKGETMTMAPLVVNDKVYVGNSGGEYGVRGWLTALDASNGKSLWRAYSTGPDNDALIGPAFKPFYPQDRGTDLGKSTWPGEAWKIGGGTVWGFVSYDPALDLIYYGTANPGPWNPSQRPGENKWTSGIFARDAKSGQARWFYQMSPHDLHDYDGINENILIDVAVNGVTHHALVHPDRNGYVYVIDRATGQVLSATPYVPITTSSGVDIKSGRIAWNPEKQPEPGKTVRDICPASPGGKDWQPAAYSPRTHLVYIPHQNLCQDAMTSQVSYIAGTPYVGADLKMKPGPGGKRGLFTAWDPAAAKAAWKIDEDFPVWSGALATAGDLVFYGTMEGWFKAVDAKTGKELWKFKTGSGIVGQPVSYRGPDGKQYVAVLSGVGGWAGGIVAGDLDPRDQSAGGGFAAAVTDLKQKTTKGGMLYVFALP
ncbi:MAG TPA: methanol/ethanol family PQQ-dependent dehydrogenase [Casimicrobiaceae bacterium]|nr:methanol/ethanol family PQQ-dependent dehydrogenase [Casimicrobiaceae bacterium]